MPIYEITAPDGKTYEIEGPPGASRQDVINAVLARNPAAGQAPAAPAAPKEGIMAALAGGAKRMGSTFETGLESLIDPNLAAQRGVARSEALGQEYAPAASLEKVKQAYAEKGLFPAAYEAISQIPGAISENVPNIAATLAGGRTGAMAGSVFGPVGALIGGGVGAAAPSLLQLYGSGLERQAQEGSKDVSRTAALGAAVPGAAAEVVSTYIPLGRTFIGKLLGPEAEKALARGTNQGIETAAKESVMATLAKGTAIGAGVEIPTEVGQQMLERLQAGLPLTTPDALKEYGESAYGAALVGGPFGAAARAAGRPGAREEYQALKQKEEQAVFDAERQAALDKYNAEEAEAQKQRDITRGQLGADTSQMLALPAPDKEVTPVDEARELINPVGDITRDELAPEVTKYIDKYRKDNGLPRLKTFSVEDVRDAMTQVNPKGERAALDSILTAKTGYTGEQKYTAENVLDAAVEKNVATETKGFNDFLARVTGTNTLDTMTQPQLFAAFKALKDMKREDTTQQLVLPEGSNASRYTQRQYDQALDYVRSSFEESGNKPLSTETILTDIKDSTKLETERDAMALLDAAIKNEDLSQSREVVFRTYREGQARPVATYRDKAKAQAAAKKQGLNVKEEALIQVAPAEAKVAPETKRAPLPTGYEIKESLLDSGTAPAEFAITPEGRGKRLTAVPTEGEATAKIPKLQALRAQRAAQMDANIAKSEGAIAKGQAQLDRLEADGKGDTEQYKVLQAKQASRVKTMNSRIELFKRQKEEFLAPLQAKPAGQKTLTRQAFTVSKDGKSVGSFPSRQAAEESILTNLPDEELAKVASDTRFGGITDRAVREQERRKEGKKGIEVKGTAEGLEKAGVETPTLKEKLKTLEDKLVPLLSKFGLKDVALNVVKSIERNAEGSYIDKLIKIAMDAENPIRTMRHEALHAMKELGFFTDAQWKALEKQARDVWIDKYLGGQMAKVGDKVMTRLEAYKQMGLSEAEIIEEAIADAFGDFDTAGKAPPGMLQALFKRMQQFFAALRQALGGAGFESAEDIFGKIERGELEPKKVDTKEAEEAFKGEKLSVRAAGLWMQSGKTIKGVIDEMDLTPDEFEATSLMYQTGKAGTEQFKEDKIGGLPEVVQFLQDERRKSGLPLLDISKEEDRKIVAKLMATEALAAIRSGGANLEWYDSIINKTLAMAGLKYPELNTDINARMAFKVGTAITSQGLNVEDNLGFAMKVYDQFRKNGKFPEIGQGEDQSKMISNFKLANYLLDDMGLNLMRQFLETEFTVEEMRSAGFNIGGELGDEKVLGSSVFGPKIGFGFYSNLNGNFDPVTMDMWFMRTIGRLTGKLKTFRQDLYDAQLDKFRNELDTEGGNGVFANQFDQNEVDLAKVDDEAAEALARKVKSAHERDFKANRAEYNDGTREKSKLVAASETMIKSLDAPKDAPTNGTERRYLRDVVRQMVDIVEEKYGKRVPPASLQAVIWYPEQELYKALGVRLRVTSQNYAGAIEKILTGEGYGETNLRAAAKLGSRTAQQLAKSAVSKGAKATGAEPVRLGALKAEEKETLLERGRKRVVLEEEKATPKRKRVIFEVAPDPNNKALTDKWRALPNEVRIKVSDKIGNAIIKDALKEFGLSGYVDSQVGSYLDDTNPSFALYLDSGDSVSMAKFLGYALSQDSMMVVSPKEGKGLDETGAVRINIGDATNEEVDSIYQKLREIEVDGEKPVGGQSYMNGHMVVLNYSNVSTDKLASLINKKLNDRYEVITENVYTAFPEKKDYDYANPSSDPKGNAGVLRQASRDLRAEATKLLQKELKGVKSKAAPAGQKLSLRKAGEPTTRENILGAMQAAQEVQPYMNCQLCVQMATGVAKIRDLPKVQTPKTGDIFVFGERKDMASHYAIDLGNGNVAEIEEWGEQVREVPLANVEEEYGKPDSIRRPPDTAYTKEVTGDKYSLRTYFPTAEEAEAAAYQKAPPGTAEFKRFFGASKVMEEGRPQAMYHGSPDIFETFYENKPIFVTPEPSFAEEFARDRAKDLGRDPDDSKIYPLWVRAETPFDYENLEHVEQVTGKIIADQKLFKPDSAVRLKQSTPRVELFKKEVSSGLWSVIEDPVFQDALKTLGFDSFHVKEGGNKNLAVFNANQVKSITGNIGDFSENKSIKYSLPSVSTAAEDRVNATTTVRDNDGFVSRMLKAISPESRSYFRQQAINRYNQLGVIDKMRAEKMGGHVLLADQSAESAALLSDLGAGITASAMGFGNRMGGIPVYKNGVTTVINTGDQKGLIAALAPLAKYNDPKVYQYYQYWAAVKRGERLYAEGREQLIQPGDRKYADELLQKFPEFEQVQKDFNKFNEGLVQYMVDTGVLSEAQGREYVKHADYVPFYRQLNEEKTIGPNIFQSISGVKQPRKLKGGDAPLADFLETVVRNTQASIQAGIKNAAAQRAVNAAMDVGTDIGAERLNEVSSAPDTVTILEKGKKVSYRVADPLFIEAVKSLNIPELPFMTLLSAPSNTLRNLVTKDPGFMMANLMRDSLSAWVTSGQDIKPIIGTVQNFAKALAGRSPGLEALLNAGVVGGYEFSNVVEASAQELAKDMQRKYGSSTVTDKALRPFTWVWEALEKGTEASDAATRIAVYERVMEETGNEAEALYRALEVMNFNRKGSSAVVRILTAAVPFLNARVQGLDVFYRASFGQMATKDAKAIQKAFWVRGMTMMALSSMYFFAVSDDEEYKKQEAETKDNYWIIPGVGKFPTPFEVGVLFKTIPERILAYSFKDDTGQDFKKSIQRALVNTFAFNPIPQTVKPVIEAATNYSFFTMRPIVGQGMEKVAPEFQVGPGTSKLAEMIGTELGLSPIKIDSIIRGYTGTIGMYGVQAIDAVLNANSDSPNASKRFEQLPVIKRFALDPEARGNITQYYELKNAVDSLAATSSLLEKSMKPDEWAEYMRENKGLFATTEYVRDLEKEMKELREMRRLVQTGPFSADSKRDYLTTIGQAENNLTKNIQTVKKLIASYQ